MSSREKITSLKSSYLFVEYTAHGFVGHFHLHTKVITLCDYSKSNSLGEYKVSYISHLKDILVFISILFQAQLCFKNWN